MVLAPNRVKKGIGRLLDMSQTKGEEDDIEQNGKVKVVNRILLSTFKFKRNLFPENK